MRPDTFALGAKVFATRYTWRIKHPRATHPLKGLHKLLSDYWALPKGMLQQRHAVLLQIINAGNTYVNSKGKGKFNSDKVMAVRTLVMQASARRDTEQTRAKALAAEINKASKHAQVHDGLKLERAANPRGVAVVGNDLPTLLQSDMAKGQVDLKWDSVGTLLGNDADNLYAIRKFLKTLSPNDVVNAGYKVLEYNDDLARQEYALRIEPTRLVWAEMDTPVDTLQCKLGDPPGTGLFAVDPDGDFFCRVYDQNPENRGWFAHSSFLAGGNAMCAGTLKIRYGRLLEICNNSGHYKPGLIHLQEACQALLDHGYKPRTDGYALFQDFASELEATRRSREATGLYRIPLTIFAELTPKLRSIEHFEVKRPNGAHAYEYVNGKAAMMRGAIPDVV